MKTGEFYLKENFKIDKKIISFNQEILLSHRESLEDVQSAIDKYIYLKINENFHVFFETVMKL